MLTFENGDVSFLSLTQRSCRPSQLSVFFRNLWYTRNSGFDDFPASAHLDSVGNQAMFVLQKNVQDALLSKKCESERCFGDSLALA